MTITKTEAGDIIVTGESIKAFRELATVHYWRRTALFITKHGMRPQPGWSVKAFNESYGLTGKDGTVKAKTWADVYAVTDSVIKQLRAEGRATTAAILANPGTETV